MSIDMNQNLILSKCIGVLINYCKKNGNLEVGVASKHRQADSLLFGMLACHLCL